jgi:hypothetical protein
MTWGRFDFGPIWFGADLTCFQGGVPGLAEVDFTDTDKGVVHEFSKMAVSLKWILDYFVGYTL